jgi:hypothetical protein
VGWSILPDSIHFLPPKSKLHSSERQKIEANYFNLPVKTEESANFYTFTLSNHVILYSNKTFISLGCPYFSLISSMTTADHRPFEPYHQDLTSNYALQNSCFSIPISIPVPKFVYIYAFIPLSAYAFSTDISTSAAVIEIRFAYIIVFLAMSILSSVNLAALLIPFLLTDIQFHPSIEGTASIYGSVS